jgi:hypothetical protein
MKFLQIEESTVRTASVVGNVSKPTSPLADDKAEEVLPRSLEFLVLKKNRCTFALCA